MGGFKHWRSIGKATYTRGVVLGFISPKHQEFHHYGFLENPWVFAGRVSESLSSCSRYMMKLPDRSIQDCLGRAWYEICQDVSGYDQHQQEPHGMLRQFVPLQESHYNIL